MSEIPNAISRVAIAASDWETAYWLPRYHELSYGPFVTEAHKADYRGDVLTTEIDVAMSRLYVNLSDAADGKLEIPQHLEIDQIEDWFISRAIAEGISIRAETIAMNARFRNQEA